MMRNDYCRTMHELSVGSDASAACGRRSELSEWPRSTRDEGFSKPRTFVGYRNRITRRLDTAKMHNVPIPSGVGQERI